MRAVLDDFLVGFLVSAAVLYAAYSLGPKSWRRRVLAGAASLVNRLPRGLALRAVGIRLARAAAKPEASCGGCGTCGSDQTTPGANTEVAIPLSKIGKR